MDPVNGPTVSEVSIANQALSFLGIDPINSFNDASQSAEWMRNNYPFLRDAVLEERMWTFATARGVSSSRDRDAWDECYVHAKPLGWLSVYRIKECKDWRVEDNNILCDEPTIKLWGLKRVTDTGKFSSLFVQALAARLAADACIPLTENAQLQTVMWQLYQAKLADAATRDGQQGSNDYTVSDTLVASRWG